MPELALVGKTDPEDLDLEPVIVPIAAYTVETKEEVIERFPFKPAMPPGTTALLERLGGQTVGVNPALAILNDLVMPDATERWHEFLNRGDLVIESETIADLIKALLEYYGQRPTRRSSGSSRTGRRSGRTSKAAPSSPA